MNYRANNRLLVIKTIDNTCDVHDMTTYSKLVDVLKEIADGCIEYRPGQLNDTGRTKSEIRAIAEAALAKVDAS